MTPDERGTIAETAIIHAATKLRIPVLKPVNDGMRYDLAFEVSGRFVRVQCKWAARHDDVVVVRCYSCRRGPSGQIKKAYTPAEVDALAAYCLDLDRCFFLPMSVIGGRVQVQLRLAPSRNNQKVLVNWADDFDFAATLRRAQLGAVAQLGERQSGTLEAAGSSPAGSTLF
jgi:PD-(D/E)XK endonuclease